MKLKTLTIVACMVTASFACLSTAQAADDANKNPTFTKYAPWKGQGQLGYVYVNPYGNTPLTAVIDRGSKNITGVVVTVHGKGAKGVTISYPVSDKAVMNHDGIPVFGLYADTLNQVTVSYKLDGKPVTENYRIQTSGIDFPVADMSIRPHPEAEVVVNTGKMNGSLYLINSLGQMPNANEIIWARGGAAQYNSVPVNVIFDTNGDIRWVLKPDAFTNYDFRNLDRRGNMMAVTQVKDGDLIFAQGLRHFKMDLVGLVKRDQRLPRGYIDYSHDQIQMPNGDLLLRVGKRNYKRPDGVVVNTIRDQIIEVNADGDLVDEWNLPEILDPLRDNLLRALDQGAVCIEIDPKKAGQTAEARPDAPLMDIPGIEVGRNWAHVNSIEYDPKDDSIILSIRHQGVIKIGRDKQVKWILGTPAGWSAKFKDKVLKPVDSHGKALTCDNAGCENTDFDWPWMQHAASLTSRGTLIVFDNGDARHLEQPALPTMKYSRGVEYRINEKDMTVQQVWEYGKDRGFAWYAPVTGNIRYDGSKDVMQIFASSTGIFDKSKKAIESTFDVIDYKTKKIELEMKIKMMGKKNMPYRAEKIDPKIAF